MIALDTSSVIESMKGTSAIKDIIIDAEKRGEEIAISTVTSFELLQHVLHKKLTSHERSVKALIASTTLLPFDGDAAEEAAKIMVISCE